MHTLIRQDHTKATPSKNPILVRTTLGSDHKDKKKSQNHTRKYNSKLLYVKKHTLINTTINNNNNNKNHLQPELFSFQLKITH